MAEACGSRLHLVIEEVHSRVSSVRAPPTLWGARPLRRIPVLAQLVHISAVEDRSGVSPVGVKLGGGGRATGEGDQRMGQHGHCLCTEHGGCINGLALGKSSTWSMWFVLDAHWA